MHLSAVKILFFGLLVQELLANNDPKDRTPFKTLSDSDYLLYSMISLSCVFFGGLMSGLTVGLMGIDVLELELKLINGDEIEKAKSQKILNLISNHHLLLVTLLLANSAAMEALPLFLSQMFSAEISVIISVTFVLAFGEVIPQALCTGPKQISIASKMVPIVKVLILLLFPISYPIAKLLDKILGHEEEALTLKIDELKSFISLHRKKTNESEEGLEKFQIKVIHGIVDINKLRVKKIMQPYKNFIGIDYEKAVNKEIVAKISESGYHYIPVYKGSKSNIFGVIKMQELFKIWEGDFIEDSSIVIEKALMIDTKFTLVMALQEMDRVNTPIAFVAQDVENKTKVVGIVTKEMIFQNIVKNQDTNKNSDIKDISKALGKSLDKRKPSAFQQSRVPLRDNFM